MFALGTFETIHVEKGLPGRVEVRIDEKRRERGCMRVV
jgi:hypothetical protein